MHFVLYVHVFAVQSLNLTTHTIKCTLDYSQTDPSACQTQVSLRECLSLKLHLQLMDPKKFTDERVNFREGNSIIFILSLLHGGQPLRQIFSYIIQ